MAKNSEITGALVFAGHRMQGKPNNPENRSHLRSANLLLRPIAQPFSEDAKFPNFASSSSSTYYNWNPNGNNLLLEVLPFPIFLLYDAENHPIRQVRHN